MLKFCPAPGCPEMVQSGLCERHRAATWKEQDSRRGNSTERGYDAAWRRFRRRFLSMHPFCHDCEAGGLLTPAQEVHHVTALRRGGARLDPANCMGLCKPCHSKRTKRGE